MTSMGRACHHERKFALPIRSLLNYRGGRPGGGGCECVKACGASVQKNKIPTAAFLVCRWAFLGASRMRVKTTPRKLTFSRLVLPWRAQREKSRPCRRLGIKRSWPRWEQRSVARGGYAERRDEGRVRGSKTQQLDKERA